MSVVNISKQILLSTLLIIGGAQASATKHSPENTLVFVQGYNVIYKNNTARIIAKSVLFAINNPTLLPLGCNRAFVSAIRIAWKKKSKLSTYYEIFDTFDPSGRIKAFANNLLIEGKDSIDTGVSAIQKLINADYQVVILTGQDEAQNAEFKKAFPIMAHKKVEVVSNYEASVASYIATKKAYGKEQVIFVCGNKNHTSVAYAEEAGFTVKHHKDALIA